MSLDEVLDALYGKRCATCERNRTTNPSRICSTCLDRAKRICFSCKGTGTVWPRAHLGPSGCGRCGGTGLRDRGRAP